MRRAIRILCLFFLLAWAFRQAAVVGGLSQSVSLRFSAPLARQQMETARTLAEQTAAPWASFWSEGKAQVEGIDAVAVRFSGDARLVFPAEYTCGAPPVDLTPDCCAVSTELAWGCYGAVDIVGLPLTVDGREYRVCGVLESRELVVLLPSEEGHTAVELPGISGAADSRQTALDFAAACGMAQPEQVQCGPEMGALASVLPWMAMVVWCVVLVFRMPGRFWMPLCVLLLVLIWIPDWWFPDRWSNILWWESLWGRLQARFYDWLALAPAMRDVPLKLAWVKLIAASLGTVILSLPRK